VCEKGAPQLTQVVFPPLQEKVPTLCPSVPKQLPSAITMPQPCNYIFVKTKKLKKEKSNTKGMGTILTNPI
jgi:hypothetical protein